MKFTPVQSLLFLILLGLSIAGWIYGFHWKRVGTGSSFTKEERMLIDLQDQIAILTEKNVELNKALMEARGEGDRESEEGGGSLPGDEQAGETGPAKGEN
ncbi:MAG: hypothetical protein MI807_11435 [Verrucomicrobiales bacterium]|nr:hypothetical protein [Verrucomicrobiales bacterium]